MRMREIRAQTGATLQSSIVSPEHLDAEARVTWDRLCREQLHLKSPFFSRAYCNALQAARGGVQVCVIQRAGQPVAFFPFQFASRLHQLMGSAERIGGELTDQFGIVARRDFALNYGDLMKLAGLSSFYFTHLPESQCELGLEGSKPEPALQIRFGEGAEGYWNQIVPENKKFFSELRRLRNGLEKRYGALRFVLEETDPRPLIDHLVEQKQAQYKRTDHSNPLAQPWTVKLLKELAKTAGPDCRGVMSTFYAGGTWVSSHFGIAGNGVLQFWFPVYNPELRSFKPGYLLLQSVINEAHTLGIDTIDRGTGDTMAKRLFANAEYTMYRGLWMRGNVRSLAYRFGCAVKWRLHDLGVAG
jgi:CelD/BcsL family acetyltransferase involved in cellulose biosynthesis